MKTLHMMVMSGLALVSMAVIGCKEKDNPYAAMTSKDETQELLAYMESQGDYINTSAPALVSAEDVRTMQLTDSANLYIIDLRTQADFESGHLSGAKNIPMAGVLNHLRGLTDASAFTRIVVVCNNGQSAAYATALLRIMGYSNAYSMKWGMSAWDSTFAIDNWNAKISSARTAEFVTTPTVKGPTNGMPYMMSGGASISTLLESRVRMLLAGGFEGSSITQTTAFTYLSQYYIVSYWTKTEYDAGHIPGAIQYEPLQDLKSSVALKTLPPDKPIVVYCHSGQTSANVVAYLKILGYSAYSLAYGGNSMIYDTMPGTKFTASEIKGYPLVTGAE